jgi:hypothetical protein
MMRITTMISLLLLQFCAFGQDTEPTEIKLKLFIPAHLKNELPPNSKLRIDFITFPGDTTRVPKQVVAKKLRDNEYSFNLPLTRFWLIGYNIGDYSYSMVCVNNQQGDVLDSYSFNILLQKGKVDFVNMKFLPPCIRE